LSHPRWLAERWYDRFGFETAEQWLHFDNAPAPLTLRANRLRLSPEELRARLADLEIAVTPGRFGPDALIVSHGHPLREPGLSGGWFVVQDEASQLVPLLAGPRPGPRVLDTCASPGGKATAIAAVLQEGGRIVACDVRHRRIDLLRRTVDRTGASAIAVVQADLRFSLPFGSLFDCVMVDAPCSGLGTLRRDPDIRWRRHEADLPTFAAAGLRMLGNAADVVAPGGRLIYATCSSEPEENEGVAEAFLATTRGFVALHAAQATSRLAGALVDPRGHLRTQPHLHGLEAFFGAVFEREM
jgi:16S rRNA (cytosine967-C5)-methyltransferase